MVYIQVKNIVVISLCSLFFILYNSNPLLITILKLKFLETLGSSDTLFPKKKKKKHTSNLNFLLY